MEGGAQAISLLAEMGYSFLFWFIGMPMLQKRSSTSVYILTQLKLNPTNRLRLYLRLTNPLPNYLELVNSHQLQGILYYSRQNELNENRSSTL